MSFGFLGGGHRRNHMAGALAGLGALTARGSNGPSKEATRVVGSFVRGIRAQGACKKTKGKPAGPCEITTDGVKLKVGRTEVGVRHDDKTVSVCIPHKADMVADKTSIACCNSVVEQCPAMGVAWALALPYMGWDGCRAEGHACQP